VNRQDCRVVAIVSIGALKFPEKILPARNFFLLEVSHLRVRDFFPGRCFYREKTDSAMLDREIANTFSTQVQSVALGR
jgi:hypothetical protein